MGKDPEEKKNPVIVVKKRRSFSPPSLAEKKMLSRLHSLNRRQNQSPPESVHLPSKLISPNRQPGRRKRKDNAFQDHPTGPVSSLTIVWRR